LANYERIKGFHLGTKDKQFYYVYLGTISIACFIASSTCLIATVIVDMANHDVERLVVGLLFGSIFGLLGILIVVGMQYTATNLENFEGYEKRVKERWPDA
jgi:hypothetical protein